MTAGIRRASVDDLAAIMLLERATFPDDAWSEEAMRSELASPHGWYVVAEDAAVPDGLAGYGGLSVIAGTDAGDIQTLAVALGARGAGLGRRILRALTERAGELGAAEVLLEVREDNAPARALYASEGFLEIARRPRYYPGGVAAIVMRRSG